jgi:hypothetical protein
MLADAALAKAVDGDLQGLEVWWGPNSTCGFYDWADPSIPTLY